MAHQGPHQGGSYPNPLFAAELDGGGPQGQQTTMPTSPDGAPIFEMPAESASITPATSGQAQTQRKQTASDSEPPQANPWPYFGPGTNDDRPTATVAPPIAAQDFASAGGGTSPPMDGKAATDGMERSQTMASTVSGPDVPQGTRPSTVSPVSPSDGHFFPAPLQILKQPKQAEPKYKPYSPEMSHGFQDAGRPPSATSPPPAGQASTVAYRPYRRPSYKESPAPGPVQAQPPSASTSPGPASPRLDAPQTSGTPPYPMGTAPHHFYMPTSPVIPQDTRPSMSPRPDQRHSPLSAQGTGHSASTSPRPHATSPPAQEPAATATRPSLPTPSTVQAESRPEEIVLWPHPPEAQQAASTAAPAPTVPAIPPQHTRPPAPPQEPQQNLSPTHTGTSSASPVYGHYHRPPPPAQSTSPTSPGHVPQRTYASPVPSVSPVTSPPPQSHDRPQASPRPSKFPTMEPQDPIPQEPPPAYSDIEPARQGSQPPPNEKASLFPQAPSSAPQSPLPQQHPQQPTYASSSSSYAPQPNHQPYGGPQQNLHPPPLPPRPSSSHSNSPHHSYPLQPTYASGSSQPPGFSGPAAPPGSFPPPPKTTYVPQHPPPGAPGNPRPTYANAYGNKFLGGSAKKWLDKTNQFVEHKIGEVLQNHPDPKYRPQPGTYGYQGGHQQQQQYQSPPGTYPQGHHAPPQGQYGHPQGHPQQPQYANQPGPPGPRP